jgi:hypothetical protein
MDEEDKGVLLVKKPESRHHIPAYHTVDFKIINIVYREIISHDDQGKSLVVPNNE